MHILRDRFDRSKRKPKTRNQRIGFAFFWLLVLAYAYVTPSPPNFNTESHLYTAFSIVDHASLNIDAYHKRLGDESYYRGHYYSDKAPGLAFLAVPVYAGLRLLFPGKRADGYQAFSHDRYAIGRNTVYFRYAITYLLLILPSALFSVFLWLFLLRFTGGSGWALALTAAYALGTIAYPYSTWYFSHQICAILLFGAFLLLYAYRRRPPDARRLLMLALAGLMSGYSIISEYPTVLIAALLGCYLLLANPERLRSVLAFVAGAVPPIFLLLLYNTLAFGKPLMTGYNHVHSDLYHSNLNGGVLGVLLSSVQAPSVSSFWEITFGSYRGIFFVCPVLLLFLIGLLPMWKRRDVRAEFWLCIAVVGLYFLMDASRGVDQNGWSGGWSIASRHLTPMLPFMIVPMAFGIRDRRFRFAFVPLAAISTAIMLAAVLSVGSFPFADHNPVFHYLLPHLLRAKIQLNWGYLLGLSGFASFAPLCVVAGALLWRIVWLHRLPPAVAPSSQTEASAA